MPDTKSTAEQDLSLTDSLKIHCIILWLQLKHFWYIADKPTKMKITKRFLRTKQSLILITSFMFVFGTIWFATHPEEHPVIRQIPRYIVSRETRPFPRETTDLLPLLGFQLNKTESESEKSVHEPGSTGDKKKKTGWVVDIPSYADTDQPAFLTAMFDEDDTVRKMLTLIQSVRLNVDPVRHLMIYNMGRDKEKTRRVEAFCNITSVCSLHKFPKEISSKLKHVLIPSVGAYKPILIKKTLEYFPIALWVDGNEPIGNTTEEVFNHTKVHNVTVWLMDNGCTVSSYAYKAMLPYFSLLAQELYFIEMIQGDRYAIRRCESSDKLLLLWIQCALTKACVSPTGADGRNCDESCRDKRPRFNYWGCHKYEAAALSVSLVKQRYTIKKGPQPHIAVADENYPLYTDEAVNMTSINSDIDKKLQEITFTKAAIHFHKDSHHSPGLH